MLIIAVIGFINGRPEIIAHPFDPDSLFYLYIF